MQFEFLTLSGSMYAGETKSVHLATTEGQITILPHHEPLVAKVIAGPVTIVPHTGEPQVFASFGGLLEVSKHFTRLLSDEADHADDLIAEHVEAALHRAEAARAAAKGDKEIERAQELVDRESVRLAVARMRRHSGPRHKRPDEL
jgi:F-type H+-transporting ATPase subunit epsilon